MAGVQDHRLAVAVSNAGGLGSLPAAMLSLDALKAELTQINAKTDKPYNVNFFCHTPPAFSEARETTWRVALKPYYDELGLGANNIPTGPGRAPFTHESADVLEAFKPPVVSFHFGLPAPDLLARVRSWGSKIISSATTVEEALWLESQGVDAVIAQGLEAGGHRGHFLDQDLTRQMGTFALLPQILQAVRIPVIAAGGIADAAGVKAALALGASAVQIGTAYMLCDEATTSPLHRAALKSASSQHTALTNLFTGRPARGIVNRLMRELGPISDKAPEFPLATGAIAQLRAAAEKAGSGDFSPLWSGQNASGCRETGAAELTQALMHSLMS
jgi:nitronate monooxygenase